MKGSLGIIAEEDAAVLLAALRQQRDAGTTYPVDQEAYQRLITHVVRRADKDVTVTVPTAARRGANLRRVARLRVGPSTLIVAQGGTQTFRIAVASFDESTANRTLSALGITPDVTSDRSNVVLRDPDGITFEIATQ